MIHNMNFISWNIVCSSMIQQVHNRHYSSACHHVIVMVSYSTISKRVSYHFAPLKYSTHCTCMYSNSLYNKLQRRSQKLTFYPNCKANFARRERLRIGVAKTSYRRPSARDKLIRAERAWFNSMQREEGGNTAVIHALLTDNCQWWPVVSWQLHRSTIPTVSRDLVQQGKK